MNPSLLPILVAAAVAASGLLLAASGMREPSVPLAAAAEHLRRGSDRPPGTTVAARIGVLLIGVAPGGARRAHASVAGDLALLGRMPEVHASLLAGACLAGAVGPMIVGAAALTLGLPSPGWLAAAGSAVLGSIAAPLAVHQHARARAGVIRRDLRLQLSAFLDVATMLLAGNVGNEGALRHAADAGDGRLFVELRRRMTEAETSGRSLVEALVALGTDLDIVELQQIGASASLASSEGAPIARSLSAKCATLRAALASEDEAVARVRTGKLSLPLVGMGIVIMALVIYPALTVTP